MASFLSRIDWRSREVLLVLMAVGMPLSFTTWQVLLNNFAVDQVSFDGVEMGYLQSVREIPGLLSFTVVFLLVIFREQPVALMSLIILGIGTAITGFFPTVIGLYLTTVLMSIGFHYYEALHQSLALQWTSKKAAPEFLGRLVSARSIASLASLGLIFLVFKVGDVEMKWIYTAAGIVTVLIGLYCWIVFPRFEAKVEQHKKIILRKRYWLWYVLVFMSGARRQIFVAFAGFLMVQKFGFSVDEMALMMAVNMIISMYLAPKIGRLIARFGERRALVFEYCGLVFVFTSYALATEAWVGAILYVLDHIFFGMAIAIKTYFQKIAAPEDIAASSSVSFTISHLIAVFLPAILGYLYVMSSSYVFYAGAVMAGISLVFAFMVPGDPREGKETTFIRPLVKPVPAE